MGTQRVNYRHASDTGERNDPDAISPIDNGERVIESVLNRPGENIRNRTEFVRENLEDQMYLSDTNIRWIMQDGAIAPSGDYFNGSIGKFTDWNPVAQGVGEPWNTPSDPYRGYFEIDSALTLEALLSVAQDAHHVESFYAENTLPPRSYTVYLTSRYQAAEGGDIIRVNWAYTATTGVLNISVTGEPKHVINIEVSSDGSVTLNQLELALLADPDVVNLVAVTNDGGDTGTTIDTGEVAPGAGEYLFTREQQREIHQIQKAVLQSFFAGMYPGAPLGPGYSFPNYLKDGDTLALYYPFIKDEAGFFGNHSDPTEVGGRRQATLTNEAIPGAQVVQIRPEQLFNSSIEPEKIPQSIPICKRIGDDLIFLDGTVLTTGLSSIPGGLYYGEHQYTVDRIISGSTSIMVTLTEDWFGAVPVSSGSPATIEAVINAIIHDLAGPLGTNLIGSTYNAGSGVSALTTPLAMGSLYTQLLGLQSGVNARAALGFDETVSGEWFFDAETSFGGYKHQISGSWDKQYPALAAWSLFYRFNYNTVSPTTDQLWDTSSWYAVGGNIVFLRGCVPDTGLTNFRAAPDDSGTGDCQIMLLSDGEVYVSRRVGLTANTVFQFDNMVMSFVLLSQDALTGDWGASLGGALTLLDDGGMGCSGGRIVGKSSESASGSLKRLFESSSTSGQSGMYMYYADRPLPDAGYSGMGSVLLISSNCHYTGGASGWVQNNTGAPSMMYAFSAWGIRQYFVPALTGSWGNAVNPFTGWTDYTEVIPCAHSTYSGAGDFQMWSAPFFFAQSITSAASLVLQSGVDWRGRRAFASLTVSNDSDFLNVSPATNVQNAINAVYACTRHVYFGNSGEASQYEFSRIYEGASPFPLQVASGASDKVTLSVNTATGDLELSTGSISPVYVMGTIMPTFVL